MDYDFNSEHISNARNIAGNADRDKDQHDAMEVDGGLSMVVDTNQSHDHDHDLTQRHSETNPRLVSSPLMAAVERPTNETSNEPSLLSNQSHGMTRTPTPATREAPAFDEDTERPRQRRRFHVTVEDDADADVRGSTGIVPTAGSATDGATEDDEVAVLESVPPRLSDLSITTPITEGEQAAMLGVVSDPAPVAQADPSTTTQANTPVASAPRDQGAQSPRINTIPLPDVPPPATASQPLDPVMEAARRLTTTPDANPDQMQADLALLAPFIAAQAMAAAFPFGGGRPPPGGGGQPGQRQGAGEANTNGGAPPPPPFPFGLPFLFGPGNGEMPPDHKRAERLANGLNVVEDGLLKRWKAVCGEEGAVCAVCYGELLEEPGIEREKDDEGKGAEVELDENEKAAEEEDAHARALREALKRREQMEKEEKEELEHKLETAVLVFPCGHAFHRTCLLPWLSRHTTCPACRFDIDPKSDTLNLPADNGMPFGLGPNGFNFGDFFTVGPVLRVPRDQAPGPRSHRWPGRPNPNQNSNPNASAPPNPPGPPGPRGAQTEDVPPPSMAELLDALFGPLLHSTAFPPIPTDHILPRPHPDAQRPQPARENAEPAVPAPAPSTAIAPSNPPNTFSSQTPPSSPPVPAVQNANSSPARASETRRRENSDRPVAMFGRLTPRRPPQPITPAWMRSSSRPSPASSSTTPVALQPAPVASPSEPGPSSASEPTPAVTSGSPIPVSGPPEENNRATFGQLRSMVANLLPRRLSSNGRAADPPVPSNHSHESSSSASTARNSHRTILRAMLRESTARLRDFAGNRRSSGGSSGQPGAPADAAPARQGGDDDMPGLESDSDGDSNFSEDAAHESDEDDIDDDMPALEPINDPLPLPIGRQNPPPSPSERSDTTAEMADNEPPMFGPPRPPSQDMMDNIITLRIDLGHADGRDETIIVPLLFNPNGRPGGRPRAGDAPASTTVPVPPQPRASPPPPPPMKKWTPPEPIKTFRQVVEEKEREAGWRCDDPLCLLGPADDDEPIEEHIIVPRYPLMRTEGSHEPVRYKVEDGIRVYADGEDVRVKAENPVCDHTLHAECLVKSARVNGWGPEHNSARNAPVTLKCPMCRAVGNVDRQVWDEGVKAEEAGEQLD